MGREDEVTMTSLLRQLKDTPDPIIGHRGQAAERDFSTTVIAHHGTFVYVCSEWGRIV